MTDTDPRIQAPPAMNSQFAALINCAPKHLRAKLASEITDAHQASVRGEPSRIVDEVAPSEEVARTQQRNRERALHACLPDGRASAALRGLACLDADQHPQEMAGWLNDPDKLTAILAGPTGSGKTMAAYAAAAEAAIHSGAAMRGRDGNDKVRHLLVRAWTVNGYLAELRPDGSPDPVWAIRDRARVAELLILDDLGAELDREGTEFVRRELVELLEYRLERRARTIFTTNLTKAELKPRLGDRFMSRVADRAIALRFIGPDRRKLSELEW